MDTPHGPEHARTRTLTLSRLAGLLAIVSLAAGILPNVAVAGTPGAELWAKRFDGAASSFDLAHDVEVTPDGSTVVVTGETYGSETGDLDFATAAYDAVTGARRWLTLYDGSGHADDQPYDLAISPDGSTAFVTGYSWGATSGDDFGTVAYDTATGSVRWKKRYVGEEGGGCCSDSSVALAVSPNGSKVFVTGHTTGPTYTDDYATVAYRASTGAQLWAKGYDGTGSGGDFATEVGVSPDGSTVFVSGVSFGSTTNDYATLAYDAATGSRRWVKRYDGLGAGADTAQALGVAPDGSTVFVSGVSFGSTGTYDYATLAYDAATGSRRWVKRYDGPSDGDDVARDLGVSPDGSTVLVTGSSVGSGTYGAATVAYDAATGARRWVSRIRSTGAEALAITADGSQLTVSGYGAQPDSDVSDYATVAYDTATGSRLWTSAYDGPASLNDYAVAVAASPDGSAVFVTGTSEGSTTHADLATVAYGA
jgi:putative pyrroloquinoline-quinone binding quinoprotein